MKLNEDKIVDALPIIIFLIGVFIGMIAVIY